MNTGSLPEDFVKRAIEKHSEFGYCPIKDYNILDMIDIMTKDYIEGKKTADQVAKEIDDKVNVFLNE